MPLDPAFVGKEYPPLYFEVTAEQIERFADAIGDPEPAYRGEAAVAPPTFPTLIQFMASGQVVMDQGLGLNYMMVVHGEQEYDLRRPLRAGDVLRTVPRIASIRAMGPHEFLTIEAEVQDQDGDVVVVARSTLISRGTAAEA